MFRLKKSRLYNGNLLDKIKVVEIDLNKLYEELDIDIGHIVDNIKSIVRKNPMKYGKVLIIGVATDCTIDPPIRCYEPYYVYRVSREIVDKIIEDLYELENRWSMNEISNEEFYEKLQELALWYGFNKVVILMEYDRAYVFVEEQ